MFGRLLAWFKSAQQKKEYEKIFGEDEADYRNAPGVDDCASRPLREYENDYPGQKF